MRHRKKTIKLGRTSSHRQAMLAGMVCDLIEHRRIRTTLPKAKAARSLAEKMVTLGKKNTLASRRRAVAKLGQKKRVSILFQTIAPSFAERAGGYTRIIRLGRRQSDSSEMALLEWVDHTPVPARPRKAKSAEPKDQQPEAKPKPSRKKQDGGKGESEAAAAPKKKTIRKKAASRSKKPASD